MSYTTIPVEMLDLVRFLAETWHEIDDFVHKHCDGEVLIHYPVVQGTRNQKKLMKIGRQPYRKENIRIAIDWILDKADGDRYLVDRSEASEDDGFDRATGRHTE